MESRHHQGFTSELKDAKQTSEERIPQMDVSAHNLTSYAHCMVALGSPALACNVIYPMHNYDSETRESSINRSFSTVKNI